jgi:hypothetical protein
MRHLAAMTWHDEHWTMRQAHELLGRAADQPMSEPSVSVRRSNDHIDVRALCLFRQPFDWDSNVDFSFRRNSDEWKKVDEFIQFIFRIKPSHCD